MTVVDTALHEGLSAARRRPELPGAACRLHAGEFLVFIEPDEPARVRDFAAFHDWFVSISGPMEAMLCAHGAVVLRGFPVRETAQFDALFGHYRVHGAGYAAGATPRERIGGNVFESTRAAPPVKILLHQEKAYLGVFPRRLAFFCQSAPDSGGETIVADMRRIAELLPDAFVRRLREQGLIYKRNFASPTRERSGFAQRLLAGYHRSWAEAFYTSDRSAIEKECESLGLAFRWLDDGSLEVRNHLPAFRAHPATGESHWFNHLAMLHPNRQSLGPAYPAYLQTYADAASRPYQVNWGNGDPIEADAIAPLYAALDRLAVAFPWRVGDVMLVDNFSTAHGRNPYRGTRNVQVMMFD